MTKAEDTQEAPEVPPARWGLGEVALALLAGSVLSLILATAVQPAGYHPSSSTPIPLRVTAAGLIGLWIGLGGGNSPSRTMASQVFGQMQSSAAPTSRDT